MTIERTPAVRRGAARRISLCLVLLVVFGSLTSAAPSTGTPPASTGPSAVHYPVPEGALFVSPTGSDRASGALGAPLRTLAAAVRGVAPGGTVVLRAGTYRESAGVVRRRVTIQPYPGEQVWLKGSVVIDDWTRTGSRWTHTGLVPRLCGDCYLPAIIDPVHPMAGRPEMVFVDGRPLRQVAERAEVRAGTFHADPATRSLALGDDPAGHLVEVTAHEQLLRFDGQRAAGSVLRGVRVAHYGSRQHYGAHGAMVVVNAPGVAVSDVTFSWSAAAGLAVFQPDVLVERSTLEHNGLVGLVANRADGLRLIGNRFVGNNAEHFALRGQAIGAAGAKITRTRRAYVARNAFTGNHATGWWCDLGCTEATVVGNLASGNAVHGLYYEVSSRALIAGNRVVGNRRLGVKVSSSDHVRLERNSFAANRVSLGVYNDPRGPESDGYSRALGLRWLTTGTVIVDNTFAQRTSPLPFITLGDYKADPERNPPLIARQHGNAFHRTA